MSLFAGQEAPYQIKSHYFGFPKLLLGNSAGSSKGVLALLGDVGLWKLNPHRSREGVSCGWVGGSAAGAAQGVCGAEGCAGPTTLGHRLS